MSKDQIRTPDESYVHALQMLLRLKEFASIDREAQIIGYSAAREELIQSLIGNKNEAAFVLAYIDSNGLCGKADKDFTKTKIWITIGKELGDVACTELMAGRDISTILDMSTFLKAESEKKLFGQNILDSGKIYADAIKQLAVKELTEPEIANSLNYLKNIDQADILEIQGVIQDPKIIGENNNDCGSCIVF